MKAPILFLIFNRPDTTQRVFEQIKAQKPPRLYIAADGPRAHVPGETVRCEQTRSITGQIDWPCEVKTLFRNENLGCRNAVSSGIDWFFSQEEEGIILEDDCLPSESFFSFCETLLERYRHDTRIGHIGGNNFQNGIKRGDSSYYFSHYNHIWGWASWRRAWKHYDVNMASYPAFKKLQALKSLFPTKPEQQFWSDRLEEAFNNEVNTWDYQWTYTNWSQNMLSILPNVNMITNIGFGAAATHTTTNNPLEDMPRFNIEGEIIHPAIVIADRDADENTFKNIYSPGGIPSRIKQFYKKNIR